MGNICIGKLFIIDAYNVFFISSLRSYHLFWSPIITYNRILVKFEFKRSNFIHIVWMSVHNVTTFWSECVNLQKIIGADVTIHECVMLTRDICIWSTSVKILVAQSAIGQTLFWLHNNGKLVKCYNLNWCCYNSLRHIYKIQVHLEHQCSLTNRTKFWWFNSEAITLIFKIIIYNSIFQPHSNWGKWVFDFDSANTRQIISIMRNYRNLHENNVMLIWQSCWDGMLTYCYLWIFSELTMPYYWNYEWRELRSPHTSNNSQIPARFWYIIYGIYWFLHYISIIVINVYNN